MSIRLGTYTSFGLLLILATAFFCVLAIRRAKQHSPIATEDTARRDQAFIWPLFWLFVAAHVLIAVQLIGTSRFTTNIDVFVFQRDAAAALLHGTNPYTITHEDIYHGARPQFYGPGIIADGRVRIGFPYLPLGLFFVLPGYLLGDIRYAYMAALVGSAFIMVRIGKNVYSLTTAALFLLNPITFYVLTRSWTEPFVLLTLSWTMFAALHRKAYLPFVLGAFLASKQYSVLAVPLAVLLMERFTWRKYAALVVKSVAFAVLVTAPLALWNLENFWRDTIHLQIVQPFRLDALSFAVFFVKHNMPAIPFVAVLVVVVVCIGWCLVRTRPSASVFACSFALATLLFFCLNKQAFCNYYFLVIGTLCVAACAAPSSLSCTDIPTQTHAQADADGRNRQASVQ